MDKYSDMTSLETKQLTSKYLIDHYGWLQDVKSYRSPYYNHRPDIHDISLLVIHNISLPPTKFGGNYVEDFFMGKLDPRADPIFPSICQMQVSAHCFIKRTGEVIQFVSFLDRAWHAGVSSFAGRDNCNDYSIGIELEGTDSIPYTDEQYQSLITLTQAIRINYPLITTERITGHNVVSPTRKTDPGASFDWSRYLSAL